MANTKMTVKFDINAIKKDLLAEMQKDCMNLVIEALATSEYMDKTYNLASSYGAAVYYDGVFLEQTLATIDFNPTHPKSWYGTPKSGQDEMKKYFQNFRPRKKGYSIILVAAMPYSEVLEKGTNLTRKYRVITGAYGLMHELASKYEAKLGYKRRKYGQGVRVSLNIED